MAKTWVALLRGINLGRNKRIAMADLRALLTSLGYGDARTVVTSGNAVFTSAARRSSQLEEEIARAIASDLGLDVKVLVRSADELAGVIDANPFAGAPVKERFAAFLSKAPAASATAALDPTAYVPDEFSFGDRVVYLRQPNGVMGSRLPDWERTLGVDVTVRTWNTVTRLHDLANA